MSRSRAETNDNGRRDGLQLRGEPRMARANFPGSGFVMNAFFATAKPFEMLHRIGDVNGLAIDSGFRQCGVEELTGGSDKRRAREILAIARLLADKNCSRIFWAITEHGLRRVRKQVAAFALGRGSAQ